MGGASSGLSVDEHGVLQHASSSQCVMQSLVLPHQLHSHRSQSLGVTMPAEQSNVQSDVLIGQLCWQQSWLGAT